MTMHQVQLTVWGEPENLHFTEVPIPSPLRGHVLLKVTAAGVNPIDLTTRKGLGPAASLINLDQEPAVLGWDVAGLVCETAGDYTGFQPGEKVFGLVQFPHPGKAYAEYVLAPAHQLVHAPAGIPDEQLGAAPLAALTAYQALFEVAKLSAGERVLIHAGAGGVGHLAIQLALDAGATVYATASEKNREFIQSLGAEFIDYTTQDFRQVLGPTLDVVLNSTGAQTFVDSLDVLVPGGRIVTLTSPDPLETARERGFTAEWLTVHPDRYQLGEIARLMSLGIVKVHVDQTFPLEQAAKAHELVGSRHVRGKVVLVP